MSKKALDITTKGWSEKDLTQLKQKVYEQNYRWEAKVETKDGQIKYCYAHTKTDVEIMAIQEGYTILRVTRKNG